MILPIKLIALSQPAATYDEGGNLRDMLLHGLRSVLGTRLLDAFRISHM